MEHVLLSCIESRVEANRNLYGRFQLGPFNRGESVTIGNALRRTLLSELSGLAIVCVEIYGVSHEYSNIKGVRESVLDILLNLKQLVFVSNEKFNQSEIGFLTAQGPKIVKACDLKLPTFVRCVNPDQYITTLSDNGSLQIKFMICKGKNFIIQTPSKLIQQKFKSHFTNVNKNRTNLKSTEKAGLYKSYIDISQKNHRKKTNFQNFAFASEASRKLAPLENKLLNHKQKTVGFLEFFKKKMKTSNNILFIDAVFMPVTKVNFSVQKIDKFTKEEPSSLENKFQNNFTKEKIILEIWTNGSIHPRHAIYQATEKIMEIFSSIQTTGSQIKFPAKSLDLTKHFKHKKIQNNSLNLEIKPTTNTHQTNSSLIPTLNKIYRPWQANLRHHLFDKSQKVKNF